MSTQGQPAPAARLSEEAQRKLDLGIWYSLFNWQDLTVAVQGQWGGPNSSDKRDWLAGAISDLFAEAPDTDVEDVEVVLLQALEDEFEARLEDSSEVEVARQIMQIKEEIESGDFSSVDKLEQKYKQRGGKEVAVGNIEVTEHNVEGDWDSVDEESGEDEDEDVDMEDAPQLVPSKPKEKPAPQVDEDGFTKVEGKRKAR